MIPETEQTSPLPSVSWRTTAGAVRRPECGTAGGAGSSLNLKAQQPGAQGQEKGCVTSQAESVLLPSATFCSGPQRISGWCPPSSRRANCCTQPTH